ncbi:MAG: hypothetical protein AB4080_25320 [Trichodesmium sp.]
MRYKKKLSLINDYLSDIKYWENTREKISSSKMKIPNYKIVITLKYTELLNDTTEAK